MKAEKREIYADAFNGTIAHFKIKHLNECIMAKKCLLYYLYNVKNFSEIQLSRIFRLDIQSVLLLKKVSHKHTLETYLNYMQNEH